jgi:hypothetical protein
MDLPCTLYVDHRRLFYRAFQQNWSASVSFNLLKNYDKRPGTGYINTDPHIYS